MAKKMDYDTAYKELAEIVEKIQDDTINIEKLSEYIKRAQELKNFCAKRLSEIEEEINLKMEHVEDDTNGR
jgi:exodeoxyribonuclease VII small subunit